MERMMSRVLIDGELYKVVPTPSRCNGHFVCKEKCSIGTSKLQGVSAYECPYTHLCMGHLNRWHASVYFVKVKDK